MVYTKNKKPNKRNFYNKDYTLKRYKRNKKGGAAPPSQLDVVYYNENDFNKITTEGRDNKCLYYAYYRSLHGNLRTDANELRQNITDINQAVYDYMKENKEKHGFKEEDIKLADPSSIGFQTHKQLEGLTYAMNVIILVAEPAENNPFTNKPIFTVIYPIDSTNYNKMDIVFMENTRNVHFFSLLPKTDDIKQNYKALALASINASLSQPRSSSPLLAAESTINAFLEAPKEEEAATAKAVVAWDSPAWDKADAEKAARVARAATAKAAAEAAKATEEAVAAKAAKKTATDAEVDAAIEAQVEALEEHAAAARAERVNEEMTPYSLAPVMDATQSEQKKRVTDLTETQTPIINLSVPSYEASDSLPASLQVSLDSKEGVPLIMEPMLEASRDIPESDDSSEGSAKKQEAIQEEGKQSSLDSNKEIPQSKAAIIIHQTPYVKGLKEKIKTRKAATKIQSNQRMKSSKTLLNKTRNAAIRIQQTPYVKGLKEKIKTRNAVTKIQQTPYVKGLKEKIKTRKAEAEPVTKEEESVKTDKEVDDEEEATDKAAAKEVQTVTEVATTEDKESVKKSYTESYGPGSMQNTLANTMINTAPKFEPLPVLAGIVLLTGLMLNI